MDFSPFFLGPFPAGWCQQHRASGGKPPKPMAANLCKGWRPGLRGHAVRNSVPGCAAELVHGDATSIPEGISANPTVTRHHNGPRGPRVTEQVGLIVIASHELLCSTRATLSVRPSVRCHRACLHNHSRKGSCHHGLDDYGYIFYYSSQQDRLVPKARPLHCTLVPSMAPCTF